MQNPPDITELAAGQPPEHKPTTQPADAQHALSSARQLPHPRYTNVAEPSDNRKVEVLRVKKSDIPSIKNANIVKKRPSSSSREEPLMKKPCGSGNTGTTSTDIDHKRPASSPTEEPLTKVSIALGASFENLQMQTSSSTETPSLKNANALDASFTNHQCARDETTSRTPGAPQMDISADAVIRDATSQGTNTVDPHMSAADELDTAAENMWMCFACMLKLGALKKRMENEDKHTCVECGECPQGIYQLVRKEFSGFWTSVKRRETSIVPGVPACNANKAKTRCESRQSCGCTKGAHICRVDEHLGCTSCHRMCHDNCQDDLCEYYACVICLSLIPSEFQFIPHEDSPECRDVQMYAYGCHACGQKQCHTKSPTCFAKCTAQLHVCDDDCHKGCSSCGKRCHVNNSDERCHYFQKIRGQVNWDANETLVHLQRCTTVLPYSSCG